MSESRIEYRVLCPNGDDPDLERYDDPDEAEREAASFDSGNCTGCSGPHAIERRVVVLSFSDWEGVSR